MGRTRRSQYPFWQRPTAIVGAFVLVALAGLGSYMATRPAPVANVSAMNASAGSQAAVAQASVAQSLDAAAEARRVAFIGDSYSSGTGATVGKRWTSVLSAKENWVELNFAVGGSGYGRPGSSGPAYDGKVAATVAAHPGIVIVSGGRNDVTTWAKAKAATTAAIAKTYADLRAGLPTARIIAVDPWWDSSPEPLALKEISAVVELEVAKVGGTYLDAGQPLARKRDLITVDGIHPNVAGHAALADATSVALARTSQN